MSSPVAVTIVLDMKPEAADRICATFPSLFEKTRTFSGFRCITLRRSASEPNKAILLEEWDSEADYEAYRSWRDQSGTLDDIVDGFAAYPEVNLWPVKVA